MQRFKLKTNHQIQSKWHRGSKKDLLTLFSEKLSENISATLTYEANCAYASKVCPDTENRSPWQEKNNFKV